MHPDDILIVLERTKEIQETLDRIAVALETIAQRLRTPRLIEYEVRTGGPPA